jgi:hypothetical protein
MAERLSAIINTYKVAKRLRENKEAQDLIEIEISNSKSRQKSVCVEECNNENPLYQYSVDPTGNLAFCTVYQPITATTL